MERRARSGEKRNRRMNGADERRPGRNPSRRPYTTTNAIPREVGMSAARIGGASLRALRPWDTAIG
jgi:hypothetical protein